MKCPIDSTDLVMTERQGIEIDYCPKCRGVWLDRGELDKVIERSAEALAPRAEPARQEPYREPGYRGSKYDEPHYYKKKKRKSLLGELFDF